MSTPHASLLCLTPVEGKGSSEETIFWPYKAYRCIKAAYNVGADPSQARDLEISVSQPHGGVEIQRVYLLEFGGERL